MIRTARNRTSPFVYLESYTQVNNKQDIEFSKNLNKGKRREKGGGRLALRYNLTDRKTLQIPQIQLLF